MSSPRFQGPPAAVPFDRFRAVQDELELVANAVSGFRALISPNSLADGKNLSATELDDISFLLLCITDHVEHFFEKEKADG